MKIDSVAVKNFRSLIDISMTLTRLTAVCGPNSAGKSNLFRAIEFCLKRNITVDEVSEHITRSKVGPRLKIQVEIIFSALPQTLRNLAAPNGHLRYVFSVTRGGTVTRQVGTAQTNDESAFDLLSSAFQVIYVPPIRDIRAGGLDPFRKLLLAAMLKARGPHNIQRIQGETQRAIQGTAAGILNAQRPLIRRLFNGNGLGLQTKHFQLDAIVDTATLKIVSPGQEVSLDEVGTGHQSTIIMSLYRQFGTTLGNVLFLFEEPDNHLHPSTIRAVADDFSELANSAQVLLSTHSPFLLSHIGFQNIRRLATANVGETAHYSLHSLLTKFPEKKLREKMEWLGVRATEPLLARRVIVVEGPTDRTALSTLYKTRTGRTVDAADILIIAATGKDKVVEYCQILHHMSVDWRAIFDWDATSLSGPPHFSSPVLSAQNPTILPALAYLRGQLNVSQKRGKNADKCLTALENEIVNGPPPAVPLDQSPVDKLLDSTEQTLSAADRVALRAAINRRTGYREILEARNCFVWRSDLEDALLPRAASELKVMQTFITAGRLPGAVMHNRKSVLRARLHELANEPELLAKVVEDLEAASEFSRTEINRCYNFAFSGLT